MGNKKLLTTQETAQLLGLSAGRVRRMILDGIIKAEKFGSSNMIKKSDAEKVKVYGKVGRPKKETAWVIPEQKKNGLSVSVPSRLFQFFDNCIFN